MAQRDAAPVILKMPPSLVGSPVLRRTVTAVAVPDRESPESPPPLPPGWWERWLVPVGELVVPVEFYARPLPAGPPGHLESRSIVVGQAACDPLYLGVRFGRARREA